jgi:hypothetical protein
MYDANHPLTIGWIGDIESSIRVLWSINIYDMKIIPARRMGIIGAGGGDVSCVPIEIPDYALPSTSFTWPSSLFAR